MCARYVITSPAAIRVLFGYQEQPDFPPRHNVAPTSRSRSRGSTAANGRLRWCAWGFVPAWVKDPRNFSPPRQRVRRKRARQAVVPQRHAPAPLSHHRRRLLRMA